MTHLSPVVQRLRITFGKAGPLRYTSNLDMAKIWERTLRRAELPLLYTRGFNTRPRISLAMPLPLGISSDCEILDISLRERLDFCEAGLRERLLAVSPHGLSIVAIEEVAPRSSAVQSRIVSAEYHIRFYDRQERASLQRKIAELLAQSTIIVERTRRRKRSVMDVRPLILSLNIDEQANLLAHLSVGDRGNLRPDDLLELLNLDGAHSSIHRSRLHMLSE
ncbi:MAG: TIGR03936 family radical SAM-associated protein [Chloroflexi bacterium]|nr:TIGR03936 family radical SAM-associated protein [Chloroflexota bacterium]MCY4247720.1 TIGR03936 family radical SAM-associated protein [Chloroflexota bacterium]